MSTTRIRYNADLTPRCLVGAIQYKEALYGGDIERNA
jgi:hypothetical protein